MLHTRARRADLELPRTLTRRSVEAGRAEHVSAERNVRLTLADAGTRDTATVFGAHLVRSTAEYRAQKREQ